MTQRVFSYGILRQADMGASQMVIGVLRDVTLYRPLYGGGGHEDDELHGIAR